MICSAFAIPFEGIVALSIPRNAKKVNVVAAVILSKLI